MAELDPDDPSPGRHAMTQLRAIAWLRWRILVNSVRRGNDAGEWVGRLLLLPFVTCLVLFPTGLAGFLAWYLAMHGSLGRLDLLLWGAFALTQLLNINLGQPGTAFDPLELIRFPISFRNYIMVRLCFGLLSPANVVVTLISFAIFVGITVDRPQLWPWTLGALGTFAVANVLFSRMVFAWVDRWLSTRRAREVFTGLIFVASLGFQYLNLRFNTGFYHSHRRVVDTAKLQRAQVIISHLQPWLRWLPPELTGAALGAAQRRDVAHAVLSLALVALYALTFLLVYSSRMRVEYRGENLSDSANAVKLPKERANISAETAFRSGATESGHALAPWIGSKVWPASLTPQLGKEFLLLRRNTGLLYGVVAPVFMVFLFAGRLAMRTDNSFVLLLAVGYALLGLGPMSYNSFGAEGAGVQLYFLLPVPLREVLLAKNLMHFALASVELCSILCLMTYLTGHTDPTGMIFVVLWAMATLLLNTSLGNLRSISAPKKIKAGRSFQRSQSQLSVWISIGVFAACAGVGVGFQTMGHLTHRPWLSPVLAALFACVAALVYRQGLRHVDAYAMQRRETLFGELGKKT